MDKFVYRLEPQSNFKKTPHEGYNHFKKEVTGFEVIHRSNQFLYSLTLPKKILRKYPAPLSNNKTTYDPTHTPKHTNE